MLAGAACAALTGLAAPAAAATFPSTPTSSSFASPQVGQAVDGFYARRHGATLWLRGGPDSPAATALIGTLQRAPLDGLASGPALAAQANALLARARGGDPAALSNAERLLATAWVLYVQKLQTPPPAMTFADSWVAPRRDTPAQILTRAAAAPSLSSYVHSTAQVNPLYAQLRDAAWAEMQATGGQLDPRVVGSLQRARSMPFQKRYIMVDAASARLYMIEDDRIVDSMKVVVGKPSAPTPMLASTIYYATVNPYWHVGDELVRNLIARNVLDQGFGYLKSHGYQVFTSYGDDAEQIAPDKVDWKAVAAGRQSVEVRQLPGPANSMGDIKFGFPNRYDIYLHDTPNKDLFAQADRDISHGCIRLEDAGRLGRWMLGRNIGESDQPEKHVLLPTPVPIYITYLTAHGDDGRLAFVDDVYRRDSAAPARVAALR
jgi:murein L,D-transpeptidase YcbB/YkuD